MLRPSKTIWSRYFPGAASTSNVSSSTLPASGPPMMLSCWVRLDTTGQHVLMNIGTSGSNDNRWALYINSSTNPAALTRTTASSDAVSSSVLATDQWYHLAAYFGSATYREIFVNGASHATNTTSRVPSAPNLIHFGTIPTGANRLKGYMALACVHIPSTDAEAASTAHAIATGLHPRHTHGLVACWDWNGSLTEYSEGLGTYPLTDGGTTTPGIAFELGRRRYNRPSLLAHAVAAGGSSIVPFIHHYKQQGIM